jgi:hypothetical protein
MSADCDPERNRQTTQTSGSSGTNDTPPWLTTPSIPQSYQPVEQGTFETSFGPIEGTINPMEFDWVSRIRFQTLEAFKL